MWQVAQEVWVCEKKTVKKWEGDIRDYKKALLKKHLEDIEKMRAV